jgi:hypothetical protein
MIEIFKRNQTENDKWKTINYQKTKHNSKNTRYVKKYIPNG